MGLYKEMLISGVSKNGGSSPKKGGRYKAIYKGVEYIGTVKNIARMRGGAVLAFLEEYPKIGIPVSKYASWEVI